MLSFAGLSKFKIIFFYKGPDVYFELEDFSGCGSTTCFNYSAIVTAELWTERIMLYYVDNNPGAWGHPTAVQSVVVDTGVGQCFEAHWADLNNDGVLEIMASCYDTRSGQNIEEFCVDHHSGWEMRPETFSCMSRTWRILIIPPVSRGEP